jgi:membrane protein implicated in regulation of membrane protease activity
MILIAFVLAKHYYDLMVAIIGILVVILLIVAIVAISRSSRKTKMEINQVASAERLSQAEGRPEFGITASELSAGDWIANPNGTRLQVMDFKGNDLVVQKDGAEPFRISPPFNFKKA